MPILLSVPLPTVKRSVAPTRHRTRTRHRPLRGSRTVLERRSPRGPVTVRATGWNAATPTTAPLPAVQCHPAEARRHPAQARRPCQFALRRRRGGSRVPVRGRRTGTSLRHRRPRSVAPRPAARSRVTGRPGSGPPGPPVSTRQKPRTGLRRRDRARLDHRLSGRPARASLRFGRTRARAREPPPPARPAVCPLRSARKNETHCRGAGPVLRRRATSSPEQRRTPPAGPNCAARQRDRRASWPAMRRVGRTRRASRTAAPKPTALRAPPPWASTDRCFQAIPATAPGRTRPESELRPASPSTDRCRAVPRRAPMTRTPRPSG